MPHGNLIGRKKAFLKELELQVRLKDQIISRGRAIYGRCVPSGHTFDVFVQETTPDRNRQPSARAVLVVYTSSGSFPTGKILHEYSAMEEYRSEVVRGMGLSALTGLLEELSKMELKQEIIADGPAIITGYGHTCDVIVSPEKHPVLNLVVTGQFSSPIGEDKEIFKTQLVCINNKPPTTFHTTMGLLL
ncbi:uncharacterized protein EI97DRAFT_462418 [Westerdykella ornata]|uniref:Uncharacterized protein n=1 Tax=Westerdykella ornata TaxID=318751 RepID=A0A6A6J8G3_WESOR|nr:uncharacterized protein EI97DRAFT_462418 [Westerdykella ornata]KAF2271926.1 hypothetical protein EI97DRAFT_462418 [Westerdykella ornata]